jgi:hypothetical protein
MAAAISTLSGSAWGLKVVSNSNNFYADGRKLSEINK